jgi:hypothetical protein
MESHGASGRIHVAEATYLLLADTFEFEKRPPDRRQGQGHDADLLRDQAKAGSKADDDTRRLRWHDRQGLAISRNRAPSSAWRTAAAWTAAQCCAEP